MPPQVDNSLAFYFSSNSMKNAVVTGTNVSYEITTPTALFHSGDRITTVTRVDRDGKKAIVGEIIWPCLRATTLRPPGSTEWVRMRDFLKKPDSNSWYSHTRSFSAAYGVGYTWESHDGYLTLSRDSYPDISSPAPQMPMAVFRPPKHNFALKEVRKAFLEVSPMVEDILDTVIVTFLMMERQRRDRRKRRRAAMVAGGAGAS